MVLEKVIELLAEYKECDSSEIKADSTFDELELDSLDTVDLLMSFEDEFNVQLERGNQDGGRHRCGNRKTAGITFKKCG